MVQSYSQLTARGQAQRLRRLAAKALACYDLNVVRLRLITNDFNAIFRVDAAAGAKYVLRITLPEGGHDRGTVAAEMAWLDALSRDTDLAVPQPLAARSGDLLVEMEDAGVPEPRLCVIFGWAPGHDLADHLDAPHLAKLGRLMAQLHAHAATFHRELHTFRYDRVIPFPEPIVLFDDTYRALVPPERRAVYAQAIACAQAALDRLAASGEPMRILHGDLHQWNVRVARGVLTPIDFEDLMWGWPVQDIGTSLYYLLDRPDYAALRAAFQQGYTSHSPWPERATDEVDAFIAARAIGMINFVLQTPGPRWQDEAPAFAARVERRLRMVFGTPAAM